MYESDFENLKANPVWKEVEATLVELKAQLVQDITEADPLEQASFILRQQGRLRMVEFIFELLQDILLEIKQKSNVKQEDTK